MSECLCPDAGLIKGSMNFQSGRTPQPRKAGMSFQPRKADHTLAGRGSNQYLSASSHPEGFYNECGPKGERGSSS